MSVLAPELEATVISIEEHVAQTELEAAASAGATTLEVADPDELDFDGGTLAIGEEIIPYSIDEDSEEVILESPLEAAYPVEEPVAVYPASVERIAYVRGADDDEELEARVPHALFDRLDLGIRDETDESAELVLVALDDDEWVIADLLYQEPVIDGTFIDPETLPEPPPAEVTDGLAPVSSPTPTAIEGGPGYLFVKWAAIANPDLTLYELHLSAASGFTPDAATLALETSGTQTVVATLGDGTPLEAGVTYYVKLIAKDADGAAAPGGEASGAPVAINFDELEGYIGAEQIAAETIIGEHIAANTITAEELAAQTITGNEISAQVLLASNIRTGPEGTQRVELDPQGFRLYGPGPNNPVLVDLPTDPSQTPYFAGTVVAENIDVVTSLVVRGTQQIDTGGELLLKTGLADPSTMPQLSHRWDELVLARGDNRLRVAIDHVATASPPVFVAVEWDDLEGIHYALEYRASDGALVSEVALPAKGSEWECRGIVRLESASTLIGWRRRNQPSLERYSTISAGPIATYTLPFIGESQDGRFALGRGAGKSLILFREAGTIRVQSRNLDGSSDGSGYSNSGVDGYPVGAVNDGTNLWIAWGQTEAGERARARAFNPAGGIAVANTTFRLGETIGAAFGLAWDGTNFYSHYAANIALRRHSQWTWTTEHNLFWLGYIYAAESATPDSQTRVSPRASIDMTDFRRSMIGVTMPEFPAGVEQAKVYAYRGGSAPAPASMALQAEGVSVSDDDAPSTYMFWFQPAGGAPPTANNFPTAPSRMTAEGIAGLLPFELSGSGHLRVPRCTTAQRLALSPAEGHQVFDTDLDAIFTWDGTKWRGQVRGVRVINGVASPNQSAVVAHGLGAAPTAVVVSHDVSVGGGDNRLLANVGAVDATNFEIRLRRTDGANIGGSNITVYWVAIL